MFTGTGAIFAALSSADSWAISNAMRAPGAWGFGLIVMIAGAVLTLIMFRLVPLLDRRLERTIMVVAYLAIATIIFVEVIRRFVLNVQAPWSTTVPSFLFLLLTWFGCAYNVRLRAHLSFTEFRARMPRGAQLACLWLDGLLWLGMSWVVIVTSGRVTANSASNFQVLLGTDSVMQWWFLILVPLAFVFLAARVLENMVDDLRRWRGGDEMIRPPSLGET